MISTNVLLHPDLMSILVRMQVRASGAGGAHAARSLSYNPAESAVLVSSEADGGSYQLFMVPKDGRTESQAVRIPLPNGLGALCMQLYVWPAHSGRRRRKESTRVSVVHIKSRAPSSLTTLPSADRRTQQVSHLFSLDILSPKGTQMRRFD